MYKGFELDPMYDNHMGTGGVVYSYNDLQISYQIKPLSSKKDKCRSNFPGFGGKELSWYYISVRVHNAGKYPVRFLNVPTFRMYMKGTGAKTARKYCTNADAKRTIRMDLRKIDPEGTIEFNDTQDGAFYLYAEGMPSLFMFKMGHYKIVNPNVDSSIWTRLNYREYEKKHGRKKSKTTDDLLDDFANDLENELNNTQTKKKNTTENYVKRKAREKAKKVGVTTNNSTNRNRNKNSNPSIRNNYSAATCQSLKSQANSVYKSILNFVRKATSGNVNYSMSQTQVMNQQMDRFSKQYINALKQKRLSPQCQREISNIMDRYTNEFTKFINRYTNGMLNKY